MTALVAPAVSKTDPDGGAVIFGQDVNDGTWGAYWGFKEFA